LKTALALGILYFFKNFPNRAKDFEEIQVKHGKPEHVFIKHGKTRWLMQNELRNS
jgi:hypothetical protein